MERRSIPLAILFSFLTCGIYAIYWQYKLADNMIFYNQEKESSAGLEIVFGIITCGIYTIYWNYKMGKRLFEAQTKAGLYASDNSILYIVLSLFGLSIISFAIMQDQINQICDKEINPI